MNGYYNPTLSRRTKYTMSPCHFIRNFPDFYKQDLSIMPSPILTILSTMSCCHRLRLLPPLCGKPACCRSSRLCATHPFPTSRSSARSLSRMIYAARISGAKLVKKSQTIQLSRLFCNINYHFSHIICQKSKD